MFSSFAADIQAVPNSSFKLIHGVPFPTPDIPAVPPCKDTSSLPGLSALGYRYSSCSEQLIANLLFLIYLILPSLAAAVLNS
jgi:hypothetical protein